MPSPLNTRGSANRNSSSVAKKAARNAMLKVAGTTKVSQTQLERVVQSVNDATKRLSQPESILSTSTTTKSSKRKSRDTVGPWKLGKTLGKGSSGRVRLAKNMETGQLAAIKIVPRKNNIPARNGATSTCSSVSYLSSSSNATSTMLSTTANTNNNPGHATGPGNPYGIEREIVIMKLISHANVLGLYEVWENKSELYLVLEYVDGGELFDYLVSKGKLCEREAVHYFRQIVQGVSYCHSFNICHRDLKPENLLLDKKNRSIKIADFGMAALEVSQKLLETSCGSPHYASPEIVMGKPYHGGPSDVWSCGIILFALLTGHLPFNDDNIKKLLLKVQAGRYQMPMNLSKEARDLISRILVVNPARRITTEEILNHPLLLKYEKPPFKVKGYKSTNSNLGKGKSNADLHLLNEYDRSTVCLQTREDIDETILSNLQILWHGASRELITAKLLQPNTCEEKIFYSLLLKYKQKHTATSTADVVPQSGSNETSDVIENNPRESNAPKLLQKSQFSIPSLREEEPQSSIPELPATLPAFSVPSSKSFKKSGSMLSLQSQKSLKSKISIKKSSSKKSLSRTNSKRTLQNSASKRSLYSQTSISKRSLNLNDYVSSDYDLEAENVPPLPSLDSNNDFEYLCDQILFGNGLDKILEEEEEEEEEEYGSKGKESSDSNYLSMEPTSRSSERTFTESNNAVERSIEIPAQHTIKPAFALDVQDENQLPLGTWTQKDALSTSRAPLKDLTNSSLPAKRLRDVKLKRDVSQKSNLNESTSRNGTTKVVAQKRSASAFNESISDAKSYSLDPRRNVSQPANSKVVESFLHKFKSKSNIKDFRRSGDWSYSGESIFETEHPNADESLLQTKKQLDSAANGTRNRISMASDFNDTDLNALAHSSSVRTKPLISLPSSSLNPTMSFKNLNEYLQGSNETYIQNSQKILEDHKSPMRKNSTKVSLAPKSTLTAGLGGRAMHSQTNSCVSNDFDQISDMSYALEIPTNTFMAQAVTISNPDSAERIVAEQSHKESHEQDSTNRNETSATIYEDERVNIFEDAPTDSETVDFTSSEGDSMPNVHRKAISIETLNNTNVLTPSTNMRVSLYVNANMNSATVLPRETTEEIISKFKMPTEKSPKHTIQKRFSTNMADKNNSSSKGSLSIVSMFRDIEEDQKVDETLNSQDCSSLVGNDPEPQPNRVTMLFDAEEEEQAKITSQKNQSDKTMLANTFSKQKTSPEKKFIDTKSKPVPKLKMATPTNTSYTPKRNWFQKLFSGFKSKRDDVKLMQTHKTLLSFDDAHMLTLNEFDKNAVEYFLKNSERKNNKEVVEYDCRFVKGNFKFKIKIINDGAMMPDRQTTITIRKKGGRNTMDSEQTFQLFNADVAKVIRQLEKKNKTN